MGRSYGTEGELLIQRPRMRSGLPLEIRVHGRGGQGGVTCAKLIATVYSELGLSVQTFGDYGAERSGAPVRAYTRVAATTITNRNKVYRPDHLLVLDPGLIAPDVLDGVVPGGIVVVNTVDHSADFSRRFDGFRLATVDATGIARKHKIGTAATVIVNTTIVGAYARAAGLPFDLVEEAYAHSGLAANLEAAREAYEAVELHVFRESEGPTYPSAPPPRGIVVPLTEMVNDHPLPLKTGSWRTQVPRYVRRTAPCNYACPAGNDVVGFLQTLREEGPDAAARVLARTQPLPSVCGRVCPGFCMEHCNRGAYDGAVNIRALERWVGDRRTEEIARPARPERAFRVAVVGGGPAGLGAAYSAASAGHSVTLYERNAELGGLLRTGIPAYRLPTDALERDLGRLLSLGVEARCGQTVDRGRLLALAEGHDAVIVATGLDHARSFDAPGASLAGVEDGLGFLRRVKEGRAARLKGRVVVVGGGNSAVDCARSALRLGADEVTIVYRRGRDEMPAIEEEIEDGLREGVKLLVLRQPVRFTGNGKVEAVELAVVELGDVDTGGRRRPVVTDRVEKLPCEGVYVALGQEADGDLVPAGWEVRAGRVYRGSEPLNVWLAGDVATEEGTVAHALGDGRRVANWALAALDPEGTVAADDRGDPSLLVTPAEVERAVDGYVLPHADVLRREGDRPRGFDEVNLGLDDASEADRCLSCGRCTGCDTCLVYCPDGIIRRRGDRYEVDEDYCKGCGLCAAECPREAMEMVQEAGGR